MPFSNFNASRQNGDFYRAEDNTFYLSHHNFPIDSFVWFNRTSVCNNEDNILNTAIRWIKPELGVNNIVSENADVRIYPNPSTGHFNILIKNAAAGPAQISLYDPLGVRIGSQTKDVTQGDNKLRVDFSETDLSSGTFVLELRCNGSEPLRRKVTVIK